tara:strand:- start:2221 stop:2970 length:750 start_codon:yes stop_codon:yes gene_type:complete
MTLRKAVLASLGLCMLSIPPAVANDGDVAVEIAYTADALWNTQGGIKTGGRYLDNLDLTLEAGVGDGVVFVYGIYNNSTEFSATLVGDSQTVSNIDSGEHFRIYEAWYLHPFARGEGSIKAGLIDLNSEFDATETAGLFLNSSHGIGPDFSQTGENGPSIFPSTSLAVRVDYQLSDQLKVRIGAFDAVPNDPDRPKRMKLSWDEGTLLAGELDFGKVSEVRVVAGVWSYTSAFETIQGAMEDGNWGGIR